MHSTLPDPVLALSLANVQKLKNIDVDQLANLWNVFTKCKESLESGRRLENLSWRLWFREAHLLPPDVSLSDITDYTPLDTPLMSRQGSVTGSYPSSRTLPTAIPHPALHGLPSLSLAQHASVNSQPLSDPEDGTDWSDDEDDRGDDVHDQAGVNGIQTSRGRMPPRTETGLTDMADRTKESAKPSTVTSELTSPRGSTTPNVGMPTKSTGPAGTSADGAALTSLQPGLPGDRKRAVSSSSAFGSRARVRQHNAIRRRRPLSFQQAIESLILDPSKDFCCDERVRQPLACQQSSSLREGMTDVGAGNAWRAEGQAGEDDMQGAAVQQSSAPAEFSHPETPAVAAIAEAERRTMLPPASVRDRSNKGAETSMEPQRAATKNVSKFFVASHSVESGSSVSSSGPSTRPAALSPYQSPEQSTARRVPSETASDVSQRAHQRSQHGQQGHQQAIHPPAKNRSAVGLSRAAGGALMGRERGHGKVASTGRAVHGVAGTHARPAPPAKEVLNAAEDKGKEVPQDGQAAKARVPVKFIMGADEDKDDYTDEESDEEPERPSAGNSQQTGTQSKTTGQQDDEDDEWSSASSTDSEDVRRRGVTQRKHEEEARQRAMFQKVPIKSASTADVRGLGRRLSAPTEAQEEEQSAQPVRGLLTSLFHPEEALHPPPGQLTGRPHASAADLRQWPQRLSDSHRPSEPREGGIPVPRVKSSSQVPSMGGLKLSKSAVALPVLSTMGSRSESKKAEAQGSRQTAVFDDDEDSDAASSRGREPTSEALERLNELASKKKRVQREGKRHSKKRSSASSLNVEVAPEMHEEEMMAERRHHESPKAAIAAPSLASHRASSMINVPDISLPQTPRTTRRNMLRDELSESLRQNLLWERQSRNRMLGIGALNNPRNNAMADSRSRSQVAPQSRNQSVLGGGALRPLTSSNSTTSVSEQRQQRPQPSNAPPHYTGDFHHAGW